MVSTQERTATVIDSCRRTALQGIFPDRAFNHLVNRIVEADTFVPSERDIIALGVCDVLYMLEPDINPLKSETYGILEEAYSKTMNDRAKGIIKSRQVYASSPYDYCHIVVFADPRMGGIRIKIKYYEDGSKFMVSMTPNIARVEELKESKYRQIQAADWLTSQLGWSSASDYEDCLGDIAWARKIDEAVFGKRLEGVTQK